MGWPESLPPWSYWCNWILWCWLIRYGDFNFYVGVMSLPTADFLRILGCSAANEKAKEWCWRFCFYRHRRTLRNLSRKANQDWRELEEKLSRGRLKLRMENYILLYMDKNCVPKRKDLQNMQAIQTSQTKKNMKL